MGLLGCLAGCAAVQRSTTAVLDALSPSPGPPPISALAATALGDEQIDQRLDFLAERLDAGRFHATLWQYGWLAVNAGGMVLASAQAPFDDGNDQVFDIIEASKGAIGVVYLLVQPMPGRDGTEGIRAMPDATHDDKVAQLVDAESLLYASAARAEQRKSWIIHIGNLVLNLTGGAILLALGDAGLAALSAGLDTTVGEIQIWTQPWQPTSDWRDYQRFVASGQPVAAPPPTSWRIAPRSNGLALHVAF